MNILVIRFTSLGDLVTLEPAFRAIRYFFKDDNISLLTTGIGKGLYQDTDYFDEYCIYNGFFKAISQLREKDYDLVINLQCNKPSHYVSMFLDKKLVVNKSYNFIEKLLSLKVKVKSTKEIIEEINLISQNIIDDYFEKNKTLIKLPVDINQKLLEKEQSKKYIAISTGTSPRWLSKKWGVENFCELIKKLVDDFQVVLVGSDLELEDADYILTKIGKENIISFVNKTNLTQLKNLLSQVDLYIGNDSGPSHIAAGVGTNTVTIFGSTDVKHCVKFIPYRGEHTCIKPSDDIKCHPCYKTKCPTNMECMASIKVEYIYSEVLKLLQKGDGK